MVLQTEVCGMCKIPHGAEKDSISRRVRRGTNPWLALIRDSKQRDQLFPLEEGEKLNQVPVTRWKTLFKSLANFSRIVVMEQVTDGITFSGEAGGGERKKSDGGEGGYFLLTTTTTTTTTTKMHFFSSIIEVIS